MKELDIATVRARYCNRCRYYFYTHGATPREYREHGAPPWETHWVYHFCNKGILGIESPACRFQFRV